MFSKKLGFHRIMQGAVVHCFSTVGSWAIAGGCVGREGDCVSGGELLGGHRLSPAAEDVVTLGNSQCSQVSDNGELFPHYWQRVILSAMCVAVSGEALGWHRCVNFTDFVV
jgi:hypothetical protein